MHNFNLSQMGFIIKEARLSAKMTQEEVAEHLGITTRYIMAIENEGKCPALKIWVNLIRMLHISADTIIYPEHSVTEEEDAQFFRMYHMLSIRDKNIIKATVEEMSKNT